MTNDSLTYRAATEKDLPAVIAMLIDDKLGQSRDAVTDPLEPVYLNAFAALEADPNQHLIVVEDEGEIVGTMQLSFLVGLSRRGAWRGLIEAVRVNGTRRGQGIGHKMMLWAIEECRRRNCQAVQLTTDKSRSDAHRFYDDLGFIASHKGYKMTLD